MTDIDYMKLTLNLAKQGMGYVNPNPMVGCVIIKNNQIIGQGWHKKFGFAHAEVEAITDAESKGYDVAGSDLYVNLEPCSHYGKTPPCADLIIEKKISRVFVAMLDPNPLVSGRGIEKIKAKGIVVNVGILEEEAKELNKYFIKYITEKKPYVILKTAVSIDGFTQAEDGSSQWISNEESRKMAHKLRSQVSAIIVGKKTVIKDNPKLNTRNVTGQSPIRVLLDSNLEVPNTYNIFNNEDGVKTIVFYYENTTNQKIIDIANNNIYYESLSAKSPGKLDLNNMLKILAEKYNISSVLVEGGAELHSSFISENIFDEIHIFQAPIVLGKGKKMFDTYSSKNLYNSVRLSLDMSQKLQSDIYNIYRKL